jgi:hypothetical protein
MVHLLTNCQAMAGQRERLQQELDAAGCREAADWLVRDGPRMTHPVQVALALLDPTHIVHYSDQQRMARSQQQDKPPQ